MPGKRINPNLLKEHRSYSGSQLAKRLSVHKNTLRNWQREGLPVMPGRPALYHGGTVRAFLEAANASRRKPLLPGTFYCFGCRDRRKPALAMVDFDEGWKGAGNLTALCEACGATMNRRAKREALPTVMPGIDVRFRQAQPPLRGTLSPSPDCAFKEPDTA